MVAVCQHSVRVRPEAPVYGDHDVTAASRPVKAFVPVRIRLVTPFGRVQTLRWAEDDRLFSTIRRAYRPWRKPWRSGFDSHRARQFRRAAEFGLSAKAASCRNQVQILCNRTTG